MPLGILAVAAAGALLCSLSAAPASASGEGSSGYQAVFTSTGPGNYHAAPDGWPIGSTVLYDFTVRNTDYTPHIPQAEVYMQRITTVNGAAVSPKGPAMTEKQLLDSQLTGDAIVSVGPLQGAVIRAGAIHSFHLDIPTADIVGCGGYLAIWVGRSYDRRDRSSLLNEGITRLAGCGTASASPPPASTPIPLPALIVSVTPDVAVTPYAVPSPELAPARQGVSQFPRGLKVVDAVAVTMILALAGVAGGFLMLRRTT